MQATAVSAGALSTLGGHAASAESSQDPGNTHSSSQKNVFWTSATEGLPGKQIHQGADLNGTWAAAALPLEVEGSEGYARCVRHSTERFAVEVPGEIHLDLMRAGRLPDPNVSDNARTHCRWPEQRSWWYSTQFNVPAGYRAHTRQRLIFEGIDLYGQVFVNSKLAGTSENALCPLELNVKDLLRDGPNELVVRVTSGLERVPPPTREFEFENHDPIYAVRDLNYPYRYLRKADYSSYGTDHCDPLPNVGLWGGVRLEGRSKVVIEHVRLDTVIRTQEVSLEGELVLENLHPWSEIPCCLELRLDPPQGDPLFWRGSLGAQTGRFSVPVRLVVPHAQLWWPNGMGEQPLYGLTVRVLCGEEETDRQMQTIGLRTLELDRSSLPEGSRFGFTVNGQHVFCKGGNWATPDLIAARIKPERYAKLIAEAKNAHFTMFRVNGEGLYGTDEFFAGCDRAGILVWQDFPFSDALYPDRDSRFIELVRGEAESAVKRLRHHPSLALWCGNSECQLSLTVLPKISSKQAEAWRLDANAPEKIGGIRIYNEILPEICHHYDPARPYWPSSPFGGTDPNSETSGDSHGWAGESTVVRAQAAEELDAVDKLMWQQGADQARSRFVSEYGIIGPPHIDSIRDYLKESEFSIGSDAWKIHVNTDEDGALAAGIRYHYGDPRALTLEQWILYGQMFQAQLQGGVVEAMRFRKSDPTDDCQGVLVWSYNDVWGEVGWSIIDYYLRRKASYYAFRRACLPVKVLVRSRKAELVTRVVNDTLKSYRASVRCGWVRLDGTSSDWESHEVLVPINTAIEVATVALPGDHERNPREWLYAATLAGEGIPSDQALWTLAPYRDLTLSKPDISARMVNGTLEVESPVYCHGVHLEDGGREIISDNYFDLLPGIPRHISIKDARSPDHLSLNAVLPIEPSLSRS
jgi:beta-mannosidase